MLMLMMGCVSGKGECAWPLDHRNLVEQGPALAKDEVISSETPSVIHTCMLHAACCGRASMVQE